MRQAFNGNVQDQINNTGNSARNLGIHFKDLERIVSGILISQAFYRIMNAVEDAAKSVLTFSNNMQMAAISMEYFLGSKERAESFLNVIKDFAAVTPFTTEQAVNMSKRLMAMGFAAENVKGVLGIMTDAAAASGGTAEQMDRIVLALGQMKTNGYIAGQELRQLAEAGIPAYKILQQELGLTTDQLRKIGKLKISGDIGVAAILTGLEKRYKGAAARIAETIPGMWSTIKDDFLLISEQMFKSPYKSLEGFLRKVRDTMEKARKTIRESGIGGLFESMFPPSLHEPIRVIIGGIRSIRTSIVNLAKAAAGRPCRRRCPP
jgi:tape measure domain-containing protein